MGEAKTKCQKKNSYEIEQENEAQLPGPTGTNRKQQAETSMQRLDFKTSTLR